MWHQAQVPSRKVLFVRCSWTALSGNEWMGCPYVTADPLKSTSPGSGSGGTRWWLFCLFFHFLQHLKTRPVIYVLPDTRVNTINKPFLMSLCNNKCNSSSSCCHIHRNLVSHPSLYALQTGAKLLCSVLRTSVPQNYFGFADPLWRTSFLLPPLPVMQWGLLLSLGI